MDTKEAIIAAIEASEVLKASKVKIVRLEQDHDIETDASRVRVEITFNVR